MKRSPSELRRMPPSPREPSVMRQPAPCAQMWLRSTPFHSRPWRERCSSLESGVGCHPPCRVQAPRHIRHPPSTSPEQNIPRRTVCRALAPGRTRCAGARGPCDPPHRRNGRPGRPCQSLDSALRRHAGR
eukprot:scaffold4124_cov378-Prasinococcus_capsulatus_cf.AAC.5